MVARQRRHTARPRQQPDPLCVVVYQDASELRAVNGQVGTLVMDRSGQVLSSTGELLGSAGDVAAEILFSMLQDSNSVLDASKSEQLERLVVTFPTYDLAVTLDAKLIYVVKRATVNSHE